MIDRINNYYSATLNDATHYPALKEHLSADVVIVGGGFTGVATAVELAERGIDVVLLEANRIGWGATGRNGGQVTGSLSGDTAMLKQLQKTEGAEAAEFIWHMRWHGHDIIQERVARYQIECDLQHGHLFTAWHENDCSEMQASVDEACAYGLDEQVSWLNKEQVHALLKTPLYHGAILNRKNMHLHSLNLCLGEARAAASLGVKVYENSSVVNIGRGSSPLVTTLNGSVKAKFVVLAGNAYHKLAQADFGGKMFPAILGNMTTAPLSEEQASQINPENLAVYDSRMVLDYYRLTADKRLMFGGGTNYSGREINDVAQTLRPALEATFPSLKGIAVDYAWTGTAGIVPNRIPLIGMLRRNVYYAQGYSGHGIATSHIVGEALAEALTGTIGRFDTFASFEHSAIPMGRYFGNSLLALGMWYYQLKEKLAR